MTKTQSHPIVYSIENQHIEFLPVDGGSFMMGSPEDEYGRLSDEVQHLVSVPSFYIAKYAVTQELFFSVEKKSPSSYKGNNVPVVEVSWYDAIEFCNSLSKQLGLDPYYEIDKNAIDPSNEYNYDDIKWTVLRNFESNGLRLPTEAEWEFAARGGVEGVKEYQVYAGGMQIDDLAWFGYFVDGSCKDAGPQSVGSKLANRFGIYDMCGNVEEWCFDWYDSYDLQAIHNPIGAPYGRYRVLRGGSWNDDATVCRSAKRSISAPSGKGFSIGFRLVMDF